MKPFRSSDPSRSCKLKYKNYRSYKDNLRKDFQKACGYCSDTDLYCGGQTSFHIDHFRPKKHFLDLVCEYGNLVYTCSYCNIAKSDDWPCLNMPGDPSYAKGQGYVDPCDPDFQTHFERNDFGQISPRTDVGRYMFQQLKLGLRRHELIWMLCQLCDKIEEIAKLAKEHEQTGSGRFEELLKRHFELTTEYFKYKGLYEESI